MVACILNTCAAQSCDINICENYLYIPSEFLTYPYISAAAAATKASADAAAAGALVAQEVFSPDSPPTSGGELGSLGRWPTEDTSSAPELDSASGNGVSRDAAAATAGNRDSSNNNNNDSSSNGASEPTTIDVQASLSSSLSGAATTTAAAAVESDEAWMQRAEVNLSCGVWK